jgi:hypothetical protein
MSARRAIGELGGQAALSQLAQLAQLAYGRVHPDEHD